MIRPERDPHWLLGVEHGREGLNAYVFGDAENQKRYLTGYARGLCERQERLARQSYHLDGPLAYGGAKPEP